MNRRGLALSIFAAVLGVIALACWSAPVFAAPASKPTVEAASISEITSTEAVLSAQIDPGGLPSTYRVEYGATTAYGSSTPEESLGNAEAAVPVTVRLSGLQAGVEYHYRLLATNALGATPGADGVFATQLSTGATSSALPDGRAYELVTRPLEDTDVYVPLGGFTSSKEFVFTERPMQAAPDGDALAFLEEPVPGGSGSSGNGQGNEAIATRDAEGGWSTKPVTPTAIHVYEGRYSGFSSDLSMGVTESLGNTPLAPGVSLNCLTLYARTLSTGAYQPLYYGPENPAEECQEAHYAGAAANGSLIAFEMPTALTPQAPGSGEHDLYEWAEGQLRLVNILPGGEPVGDARFGSPNSALYSHVVSADGSRLFWTDLADHDLYVREDGGTPAARTALVAEDAEYQTASSDGSTVVYTKAGSLFSFDVESGQADELAQAAEVQGVLGASEDGAWVYFVAKAALRGAGGEALQNSAGAQPVTGEENLYLVHAGATRFIATLGEGEAELDWVSGSEAGGGGGHAASPTNRAEVAADGSAAVFTSSRPLTGYDNTGPCQGETHAQSACSELYVYEAEAESLACVSCNPDGAAPEYGPARLSGITTNDTQLPRWINDDGDEVFFESPEPLVPQHRNGQYDVFEWEREGAAGCKLRGGCVYLLSGDIGRQAVFIDASASGDDVFFVTRAQLLPEDSASNAVIYDARVGAKPVSQPLCTGTGCQGLPPAPPLFATPASVTFNGVGNFAPAASQPTAKKAVCPRKKKLSAGKCVKAKTKPRKRKSKHAKSKSKRAIRKATRAQRPNKHPMQEGK